MFTMKFKCLILYSFFPLPMPKKDMTGSGHDMKAHLAVHRQDANNTKLNRGEFTMKQLMSVSFIALVTGTLLLAAHAADTVSATDRAFVAMVSQGGMFEVKAGQLAAEQGSTQDIKDQGTTEAHDHQLVGNKLRSIAQAASIPIADSLNTEFQKQLDDLKALSGTAFDRAYLSSMNDIHNKDGAAFAKEATTGSNPDLRAFATETHRIVVRHLGELHATP